MPTDDVGNLKLSKHMLSKHMHCALFLTVAFSVSAMRATFAQGDPPVVIPQAPTVVNTPAPTPIVQPKTEFVPNVQIPIFSTPNATIIPLDQNRQTDTPHMPVPQGVGTGLQSKELPPIINKNLMGNPDDEAKFVEKINSELVKIISLLGTGSDPSERQRLVTAYLETLKYAIQLCPDLANDVNFKDALKLLTASDAPELQVKLMTLLQLQFRNSANLLLAKTEAERSSLLAEKDNLGKVAQKIFGQIASTSTQKNASNPVSTANANPVVVKVSTLSTTPVQSPTTVTSSVSPATPISVTQTSSTVANLSSTQNETTTVNNVPTNISALTRTPGAVPVVTIQSSASNNTGTKSSSTSTTLSSTDVKALQQAQKDKADAALGQLSKQIASQPTQLENLKDSTVSGLMEFANVVSGRPDAAARAGAPKATTTTTVTPNSSPPSVPATRIEALKSNAANLGAINSKISETDSKLYFLNGEMNKLQQSNPRTYMFSPQYIALKTIQAGLRTSLTNLVAQKTAAEKEFVNSFSQIAGARLGDKLSQTITGKNMTQTQLLSAATSVLIALMPGSDANKTAVSAKSSSSANQQEEKQIEAVMNKLSQQMEAEKDNLKAILEKFQGSMDTMNQMMQSQQDSLQTIQQHSY